jgi:hypothetical protein
MIIHTLSFAKEDFMLKSVTLSSNGRLPRTYKTYKIVRVSAHSTAISTTERVKWYPLIASTHIKLL